MANKAMDKAADGVNRLTVVLIHAQKKYDITLSLPENEPGGVIMNRHLAEEVARVTGIIPRCQRIIFSGKTLQDPYKSLKEEGLTKGCKIMLLSKPKVVKEDDPVDIQLSNIDKDVDDIGVKISDTIYKIDSTIRGYPQPLSAKNTAYMQMERQLVGLTETLSRILEKLDAMALGSDPPRREKRLSIVTKIQKLLKKADDVNDGVTEKIVSHEKKTSPAFTYI